MNKTFGIIGNPVEHSLSPLLHNYWLKKYDIDAIYSIIKIEDDGLSGIVKKIKEGFLSGVNVTLPYKQKIINHVDQVINDAKLTGSVNTLLLDKDIVVGENTDVFGLQAAYLKKLGNNINKKALAITAVGENQSRKKLVKLVEKKFKNIKWAKVISRDAIVNKNVTIKEGSLVVSGAVVNTNSKIGSHCVINTLSSLDHDVKLGDYSDIAPGVNIAGNVTIGNNVFIGIGSSLIENIKI